MISKDDLKQYRHREGELRQLERLMERLRQQMSAPTIPILSDMPKGNRAEQDIYAAYVARLDGLMRLYNEIWDKQIAVQQNIEYAIDGLPPVERQLIRLRYIDGLEWEQICVDMHFSWGSVHGHHRAALEKLAERKTLYTIVHGNVL